MSSRWPPRLEPGARGGMRRVAVLPSAGEVAALDPAAARAVALAGPDTKATLLDAIAVGLEFARWFGRNWDALEELLRAPQPDDDRAIVIVWHDPDRLPPVDRRAARAVFSSAAEARRAAGKRPLIVVEAAGGGAQREEEERPMTKQPALPPAVAEVGRIHHVAIVVRSIDAALAVWRDVVGLRLETVMDIAQDRVRIAFLAAGDSKIELVEPTDDTTGVARFLAARGEGFHHVCLEVEDLASALAGLAAAGLELIDTAPRRGAEGPVAFIHPRSCNGALVELIEAPGGPAWAALGFTAGG